MSQSSLTRKSLRDGSSGASCEASLSYDLLKVTPSLSKLMIVECDGAGLGRGRTSVIITKSEKASGACRYAVHIVGFHDGLSRSVNYLNVGREHVLDTHDAVNRSTVFE